MASVEVTDNRHTQVTVHVSDLQYELREYGYFVFEFYQNSRTILSYTYSGGWGDDTAKGFIFPFTNSRYLGNNWFAPGTSYSVTVYASYGGTEYSCGSAFFRTDSISPPSGTITPAVWPKVKNQGSGVGSCVADAITSAMELFHAMALGNAKYEEYSTMYFFGSDGRSQNNMMLDDAVFLSKSTGAPRWELLETEYGRHISKADAGSLFENAVSMAHQNAAKQCFSGCNNIDFYDCNSVANAIRNNGCFLFSFRIPNNFYDIPTYGINAGVVPQPANGWAINDDGSGAGHTLLLIGLTEKNGKKHWIGQNSWGTDWGDNGICYIPYDWGCGVQGPQSIWNTGDVNSWTMECYAPYDYSIPINHPSDPVITEVKMGGDGRSATITFTKGNSSDSVLLYARQKGTEGWYPKSSGSGYGVTSTSPARISLDNAASNYEFSAISVYNNMLSFRSDVVSGGINVDPWDWYASNGEATASQTVQFYKVLCGTALPEYSFSYKVWNDLVEKVAEVLSARGTAWYAYCGYGKDGCKVRNGEAFSASKYNEVRFQIGSIISTGISDRSAENEILGRYITAITDTINTIIST